jgi:eukaryotic-like serine/threonine-protein kinase
MDSGKQIGDYEILGELGQGGMGRVYRVRNVISDRIEAMKVLLPDLAGRQDLAARFLREIKVLAALNHPNIAALRTALTSGNQLVMIMEYVEGQSLAERLARGPIAPADAVSYIDQVLDALTYAHGRGVVHRDIKPANMMLTASGVVKLTDFGIARSTTDETITTAGTTTGSLSYMSPEQVSGQATDARSDLYSVGISLYEMVTGQRPFRADNDFHVMLAHLKEAPRPPLTLQPTLPPPLNAIIMRAIAKAPAARFQSAQEFRDVLGRVFASESTTGAGQTTVLISTSGGTAAVEDLGGPTRGASDTPAGAPSDHARAVPDTQTPPEAPPAIPAAAPMSAPTTPPVVRRSGLPLLFVALGVVLTIAALVGTGLYLRLAEAGADRSTEGAVPADPPAESSPDADPLATHATADDAGEPAGVTPSEPPTPLLPSATPLAEEPPPASERAPDGPAPPRKATIAIPPASASGSAAVPERARAGAPAAAPARTTGPEPAGPATSTPLAPPEPAQPAPADTAELDAIEAELDRLAARAAAVTSSLAGLNEQQARQGFGLRGDIVTRHERMRTNLSRAQEAVATGDLARARKFSDTARGDVEALERFLGR